MACLTLLNRAIPSMSDVLKKFDAVRHSLLIYFVNSFRVHLDHLVPWVHIWLLNSWRWKRAWMLFHDHFLSWLFPLCGCLFWYFCWCPGGKEGVLVVWQLDTGKKKFLPRIGSPLLYFTDSPDPTLSSVRRILLHWNSELFYIKLFLSLLKQNYLILLIWLK